VVALLRAQQGASDDRARIVSLEEAVLLLTERVTRAEAECHAFRQELRRLDGGTRRAFATPPSSNFGHRAVPHLSVQGSSLARSPSTPGSSTLIGARGTLRPSSAFGAAKRDDNLFRQAVVDMSVVPASPSPSPSPTPPHQHHLVTAPLGGLFQLQVGNHDYVSPGASGNGVGRPSGNARPTAVRGDVAEAGLHELRKTAAVTIQRSLARRSPHSSSTPTLRR
jgi:hypothetical protein